MSGAMFLIVHMLLSEITAAACLYSATIFGEVLLRSPLAERKGRSKRALASMNRKKATFIYQFLVNDLTIEYQ